MISSTIISFGLLLCVTWLFLWNYHSFELFSIYIFHDQRSYTIPNKSFVVDENNISTAIECLSHDKTKDRKYVEYWIILNID